MCTSQLLTCKQVLEHRLCILELVSQSHLGRSWPRSSSSCGTSAGCLTGIPPPGEPAWVLTGPNSSFLEISGTSQIFMHAHLQEHWMLQRALPQTARPADCKYEACGAHKANSRLFLVATTPDQCTADRCVSQDPECRALPGMHCLAVGYRSGSHNFLCRPTGAKSAALRCTGLPPGQERTQLSTGLHKREGAKQQSQRLSAWSARRHQTCNPFPIAVAGCQDLSQAVILEV